MIGVEAERLGNIEEEKTEIEEDHETPNILDVDVDKEMGEGLQPHHVYKSCIQIENEIESSTSEAYLYRIATRDNRCTEGRITQSPANFLFQTFHCLCTANPQDIKNPPKENASLEYLVIPPPYLIRSCYTFNIFEGKRKNDFVGIYYFVSFCFAE